jgi:hypothetical protein
VTTPDRLALLAAQDAWAAGKAATPPTREDDRTHQQELEIAHTSTTVAGATPASGEGHGPWPRRPI